MPFPAQFSPAVLRGVIDRNGGVQPGTVLHMPLLMVSPAHPTDSQRTQIVIMVPLNNAKTSTAHLAHPSHQRAVADRFFRDVLGEVFLRFELAISFTFRADSAQALPFGSPVRCDYDVSRFFTVTVLVL